MDAENEARIDELIGQLYESDRYIDLDLMAEIMGQEDEIVDHLIKVVEASDDWPGTHALLMLIEMRAEKALPAIRQTLLAESGLNEWVDTGDMAKFGPVAIDTLESMVTDEEADWYARAVAGNALVKLAARYPETYERVTAILRSVLPDPEAESYEDKDPDAWTAAVSDLVQLRDPKAFEIIGQLFDAGMIDTMWISPEDVERSYRGTDPFYRVNPEPRKLLESHRAMQERWRISEARSSAPAPPPASGLAPMPAPWHETFTRSERKTRRQKRKTQRASRRKQRRKKKKKRR